MHWTQREWITPPDIDCTTVTNIHQDNNPLSQQYQNCTPKKTQPPNPNVAAKNNPTTAHNISYRFLPLFLHTTPTSTSFSVQKKNKNQNKGNQWLQITTETFPLLHLNVAANPASVPTDEDNKEAQVPVFLWRWRRDLYFLPVPAALIPPAQLWFQPRQKKKHSYFLEE